MTKKKEQQDTESEAVVEATPEVVEDLCHDGRFAPQINVLPGLRGCPHSGAFFFPQTNDNIAEAQIVKMEELSRQIDEKTAAFEAMVETKLAALNKKTGK